MINECQLLVGDTFHLLSCLLTKEFLLLRDHEQAILAPFHHQVFLFVIIGGHIGNFLNLKMFPARLLALITSTLVLFVAIRMGIKLFL